MGYWRKHEPKLSQDCRPRGMKGKKAFCYSSIQGNYGMRQREINPAAQLVKFYSAAKGLHCESELGSRSESCG